MLNNVTGLIDITLRSQQPQKVTIQANRPLQAARLLIGKTPQQALDIIPLLFNICGTAQAYTALQAISQQQALTQEPTQQSARELLVLTETAKEALLRIFLDWPRLCSLSTTDTADLRYVAQLNKNFSQILFQQGQAFLLHSTLNTDATEQTTHFIDTLEQFLVEHIFQMPLIHWLQLQNNTLQHWAKHTDTLAAQSLHYFYKNNWQAQGAVDCRPLPHLDEQALLSALHSENAAQFIAWPQWQQHCYESTALSRQLQQTLVQNVYQHYAGSLLTRWVARLAELATIPAQMRQIGQKTVASQHHLGIAQTEAARGRLIHYVDIQAGIISRYQILAPTEWNFHPQGLLAQSLAQLKSKNAQQLQHLADLMVHIFDPCVAYQIKVT